MIRLILFAPCEKVLQSDVGNSSLISVLESVTVQGEIPEELPENASLPMRWVSIALWSRIGEVEEPITYNSKVELVAPDGKAIMGGSVEFTVSNDFLNYRNTLNFPLIPIGQTGTYALKLFYKKNTSEEWTQAGEFPLHIRYEEKEEVGKSGSEKEIEQGITSEKENEQPAESV